MVHSYKETIVNMGKIHSWPKFFSIYTNNFNNYVFIIDHEAREIMYLVASICLSFRLSEGDNVLGTSWPKLFSIYTNNLNKNLFIIDCKAIEIMYLVASVCLSVCLPSGRCLSGAQQFILGARLCRVQ